jgi:low affinity Fe/Cu permease
MAGESTTSRVPQDLRRLARNLARAAPGAVGSTAAFVALCILTLVWVGVGPFVDFSEGWLLVPSALASIVALLLVVLLQYSQNRDTRALQLKLDEVIRALGEARSSLVRLEQLSDEELAQIETEFDTLRNDVA